MNYMKITTFDVANGKGIRVVLWVSGCNHHCFQCHNPQTWDLKAGKQFTRETINILLRELSNPYIDGLTLSGGDPLHPNNRKTVESIIREVKQFFPNKSIWLYTGYLWEEVRTLSMIPMIDVLVDGEFHIDEKDVSLAYCGSRNQRVIDVKKTFDSKKIILFEREIESV